MSIKKEEIEQCIKNGMSNKDTYTYLNISKSKLFRLCKTYGLCFEYRSKNLNSITEEKIKELILKGYTLDKAAEELSVSRSFLAKKSSEFNLSFSKQKFKLEKYNKLKSEKKTDKEISKILGMTTHGLYMSKVSHGLNREDRNFDLIPKEIIIDLYLNKRLPVSEIALHLNKGVTTVYSILKQYNIQLRREDGAHLTKDQLLNTLDENRPYADIANDFRITEDALKKAIIRNDLTKEELFSIEGDSLNRFTEIQKQMIYGSLLGDGHLDKSHSNCNLSFEHSLSQKEYVEYKSYILKNFVQEKGVSIQDRFDERTQKTYTSVSFKSIQSKIFSEIYPLFYNPKKYVHKDILYSLNPIGLAFWFMDDGYKYNDYSLAICTESFTKEDTALIILYFKDKWEIECDVSTENRLIFRRVNAFKFQSLISLHVLPMFYYKLINISHQKLIKDNLVKGDLKTLSFDHTKLKISDLVFSNEKYTYEINKFIERYEWLGKSGNYCRWVFTARYLGKLAGVVLINEPLSYSNLLKDCSENYEALIQRGCSASWAPKNLGSSLIMFSLRWMVSNTTKRVFVGYADTRASEIGTIYQACNFEFLGNDFGSSYVYYNSKIKEGFFSKQSLNRTSSFKKWCKENKVEFKKEWIKENNFKDISKIPNNILEDWKNWKQCVIKESFKMTIPKKGKYVLILGKNKSNQKYLNKLKNYSPMEYPKR